MILNFRPRCAVGITYLLTIKNNSVVSSSLIGRWPHSCIESTRPNSELANKVAKSPGDRLPLFD
jgi:hypothetical protein